VSQAWTHHNPLVVSERRLLAPNERLDQRNQVRLRLSVLAELLQDGLGLFPTITLFQTSAAIMSSNCHSLAEPPARSSSGLANSINVSDIRRLGFRPTSWTGHPGLRFRSRDFVFLRATAGAYPERVAP
jgi:hypothetical protein